MKSKVLALGIALLFSSVALGAPVEIPEGSKCHACGMSIESDGPFASQITTEQGPLLFCDIGDMLHTYGGLGNQPPGAYVRDFTTNEWLQADKAVYVRQVRFSSPMGWDIAAFATQQQALRFGPLISFREAMEVVRK